jgi:hypothetical protein
MIIDYYRELCIVTSCDALKQTFETWRHAGIREVFPTFWLVFEYSDQ